MPSGSDERVKASKEAIEQTNKGFHKVRVEKEKKDTRQDAVEIKKSATGMRGEAKANREAQRKRNVLILRQN
jgi:hypothetical protein